MTAWLVANAADEGKNVITGMLVVGLIFIGVIALGELSRAARRRRGGGEQAAAEQKPVGPPTEKRDRIRLRDDEGEHLRGAAEVDPDNEITEILDRAV